MSRDNARTPMQWDDSKNAGFTEGTAWIKVNENYRYVNAASQIKNPDSVFSYYKKLIQLRHENDIIVYGTYNLLLPESDELFVYTRTLGDERLMVICNFTDRDVCIDRSVVEQIPDDAQLIIANYECADKITKMRPYEARVYKYVY